MKNKLIAFLTLLTVPSVTFAMVGIGEQSHIYKTWIYPATIYNLKLFIGFLIVFAFVYFIFRRSLDKTIKRFSSYLMRKPALAVITCGLLFWMPYGIIVEVSDYWYKEWTRSTFYAIFLISTILGSIILLACGRFRNKVLISPLFLKVSSVVLLSEICAGTMFIIFMKAGVLDIDSTIYYGNKHGYIYVISPLGSILSIWRYSVYLTWLILYSLIILWIGNAYRWLKNKIEKRPVLRK